MYLPSCELSVGGLAGKQTWKGGTSGLLNLSPLVMDDTTHRHLCLIAILASWLLVRAPVAAEDGDAIEQVEAELDPFPVHGS